MAISVGLDKKLMCCDTKIKKTILQIVCEQPLTSADFDQDGTKLSVGTSRGRILVYDLRSPKAPVTNIVAHNSSVTNVAYKHKPSAPPSGVSGLAAGRSRTRLTQQKSGSSLKPVMEEGKENSDPAKAPDEAEEFSKANENMFKMEKENESIIPTSYNRRESLSSMIFSPLRDSDTSINSHVGASLSRDMDSRLGLSRPPSEARRFSNDSVFSPLRDSPGPGSTGVSFNKRTPFTSFNTPPTMSPLTIIREEDKAKKEEEKHDDGAKATLNQPGVKKFTGKEKLSLESLGSFVKESLDPGTASPSFAPDYHDKSSSVHDPVMTNVSRNSSNASRSSKGSSHSVNEEQKSEFRNILTAFPQVVNGRGVSMQNERHSVNDFR